MIRVSSKEKILKACFVLDSAEKLKFFRIFQF